MSWADEVANDFGYQYAILFARARDALAAYVEVQGKKTILPLNICPAIAPYAESFEEVDDTGLCPFLPVQLYGYRMEAKGCLLEIDPLMTGYRTAPICESSIISFNGKTKMLQCTAGGMLMTNNQGLAEAIEEKKHWKNAWNRKFTEKWLEFDDWIEERFERIAKWDALLGDSLIRIPREQVMPWRVMRRVPNGKRDELVKKLRLLGIAVGTNYPPLIQCGSNIWGDTVINFLIDDMPENWGEIIQTIEDVVYG